MNQNIMLPINLYILCFMYELKYISKTLKKSPCPQRTHSLEDYKQMTLHNGKRSKGSIGIESGGIQT